MRADAYSIRSLIQTDICYRIPIFQRRYVWKEEQWERFAEDMDSLLDDDRKYFLGSLILKGEALGEQDQDNYIREKYIVIDGQQRLTTLFIYMKLLFLKTGCIDDFAYDYCRNRQLNQPILDHNSDDTAPFRDVLSREIFAEINNPKSNIEKAHNFFVNHLKKYGDDTETIGHLRRTIEQRVNFVGIKLEVGENNEQQIFDTINNLGVDLDTAELLKNFLFIRQEDEQRYRREGGWKSMFDSDEAQIFWKRDTEKSRQNVKKENKNIEQFLNAYVRIKMYGDYKERFTEQRRKTLVKLANTYDACKDLVEVCGVSRQDLADEIIEYARLFKEHFVMDKLDEPIKSYHCIERIIYIILATKKYSLVPYVLFLLKNVSDQNELDMISKYLESYVVRRILAANTKDKSYSDLFGESLISQNITTAQGLKDYIRNRAVSNLKMPSAFDIINGITVRSTAVGEETARLIYYLYDVSFNNNNNLSYNDCLAVELMPRSVANTDWTACNTEDQENTRLDRCKTFGNYFLIKEENYGNWKKAKRKEAKIRHIHGCKEMFASNQILDDPNLHRPVNDWTSDSINDRNKLLAKAFDGTWEI